MLPSTGASAAQPGSQEAAGVGTLVVALALGVLVVLLVVAALTWRPDRSDPDRAVDAISPAGRRRRRDRPAHHARPRGRRGSHAVPADEPAREPAAVKLARRVQERAARTATAGPPVAAPRPAPPRPFEPSSSPAPALRSEPAPRTEPALRPTPGTDPGPRPAPAPPVRSAPAARSPRPAPPERPRPAPAAAEATSAAARAEADRVLAEHRRAAEQAAALRRDAERLAEEAVGRAERERLVAAEAQAARLVAEKAAAEAALVAERERRGAGEASQARLIAEEEAREAARQAAEERRAAESAAARRMIAEAQAAEAEAAQSLAAHRELQALEAAQAAEAARRSAETQLEKLETLARRHEQENLSSTQPAKARPVAESGPGRPHVTAAIVPDEPPAVPGPPTALPPGGVGGRDHGTRAPATPESQDTSVADSSAQRARLQAAWSETSVVSRPPRRALAAPTAGGAGVARELPVVPIIRLLAVLLVPAAILARSVDGPSWGSTLDPGSLAMLGCAVWLTALGLVWLWRATTPPFVLLRRTARALRDAQARLLTQEAEAAALLAAVREGSAGDDAWRRFEEHTGLTLSGVARAAIEPDMDPASLVRYLAARQGEHSPTPRPLLLAAAVPAVTCLIPAALVVLAL